MAKTYKLTCKTCNHSYRCDSRRGAKITEILKTNPIWLDEYECQNCSRGVTSTPKKTPKKMKTIEKKPEVQEKLVKTTFEVSKEKVVVKKDVVKIKSQYDLSKHIPKRVGKYIHRHFGKGKERKKDVDILKWHLDATEQTVSGFDHRIVKNVLLIGETGTGKTKMIEYFCHKNKLPYYRVVMNGGTTGEDIVGQMIPSQEGYLKFAEQILIQMMREGGVFVFDEINAGQRDILHILNSLTDEERRVSITQKDGEVVNAVDNFLLVACMNPPTEYDMNELPKSLKSRFCAYPFNYDIKIDKKVLGKGEEKLIEFTKKIRQARRNGVIETPLSTRDLVQFKIIRDNLGYSIAKEMLINKFQNGEKSEVKTELEICLEQSDILNEDDKNEQ